MTDDSSNDKRKQWNSEFDLQFAAEVTRWHLRKGLTKQQVTQAGLMMFMQADPVARDNAGEAVVDWIKKNSRQPDDPPPDQPPEPVPKKKKKAAAPKS